MRDAGKVMLVNALQFLNAFEAIVTTPFNPVTVVRLLQFSKAPAPIFATVSGIYASVRLVLFANAEGAIEVTLRPFMTDGMLNTLVEDAVLNPFI